MTVLHQTYRYRLPCSDDDAAVHDDADLLRLLLLRIFSDSVYGDSDDDDLINLTMMMMVMMSSLHFVHACNFYTPLQRLYNILINTLNDDDGTIIS